MINEREEFNNFFTVLLTKLSYGVEQPYAACFWRDVLRETKEELFKTYQRLNERQNMKAVKTFGGEELTQLMCGDTMEYFSVEALDDHKKVCDSCADNYAEENSGV
jgi:hypothetical protein